jgi:hypothetical protein
MKRHFALAVLAVASLSVAADGQPQTSERFAYYTFREQTEKVTVLVDSFPASLHGSERFFPLSVAVGLQAPGASITVTPESFTLTDATGKSYSAVPYGELMQHYGKRQFDEELLKQRPLVVGEQFSTSLRLPARFYPLPSGSGTRMEQVNLAPFTWFEALVYFPVPESGLRGVLKLRVAGGGIDPPLEVRFDVPKRDERS